MKELKKEIERLSGIVRDLEEHERLKHEMPALRSDFLVLHEQHKQDKTQLLSELTGTKANIAKEISEAKVGLVQARDELKRAKLAIEAEALRFKTLQDQAKRESERMDAVTMQRRNELMDVTSRFDLKQKEYAAWVSKISS